MQQVKERDNPSTSSVSIKLMLDVIILNNRLSSSLKVSLQSFSILLIIYREYVNTGFGMSCQELCLFLHGASNNYTVMNGKLTVFVSKGLIEVVGTTRGHAKLFAPTPYLVDYIGLNYRLVECKESADIDQ